MKRGGLCSLGLLSIVQPHIVQFLILINLFLSFITVAYSGVIIRSETRTDVSAS